MPEPSYSRNVADGQHQTERKRNDANKLLHDETGRGRVGKSIAIKPATKTGHDKMTPEDVIAYGEKKHGERWINRLAKDLNYSPATVSRIAAGQLKSVSRRMELEMKRLIREDQMRYMKEHATDVKY